MKTFLWHSTSNFIIKRLILSSITLKIFGDKDADGFYRGECAGRVGYIPCNMVSEIQVDDPELEEQLMREVQDSTSLSEHLSGKHGRTAPLCQNTSQVNFEYSTSLSEHLSGKL